MVDLLPIRGIQLGKIFVWSNIFSLYKNNNITLFISIFRKFKYTKCNFHINNTQLSSIFYYTFSRDRMRNWNLKQRYRPSIRDMTITDKTKLHSFGIPEYQTPKYIIDLSK